MIVGIIQQQRSAWVDKGLMGLNTRIMFHSFFSIRCVGCGGYVFTFVVFFLYCVVWYYCIVMFCVFFFVYVEYAKIDDV